MKRDAMGERSPIPQSSPARAGSAAIGLGDRLCRCLLAASLFGLALFGGASTGVAQLAPEASSSISAKPLVTARRHMAVTANPHATEAALQILRDGGTAVDAAIAAQLVLNLVEPQSSGLGGGGFLLFHDARSRRLTAYDGREAAPAATGERHFIGEDGEPVAFMAAVTSGLSVGVPALAALLATAHKAHGGLPLAALAAPAIQLAEQGFAVSPRLAGLLARIADERESFNDAARAYFFADDGAPRPEGHILRNPAFAATLRAFTARGATAFRQGPIAEAIVEAVQSPPARPGTLDLDDLANYEIKVREPLCISYRRYRICGMGPPSSGMLAVAQTLKLVEPFNLGRTPLNAQALHLIAEAQKLAFADRARYVADPDHVPLPHGLLDRDYLAERRGGIDRARATAPALPGTPRGAIDRRGGLDQRLTDTGTTHISVIDRFGNAVALTSSIEHAFGARLMTGGFLLNNQLTDFSFLPVDGDGDLIANRAGANKRPRSSMSPTIVYGVRGDVRAVLGSAGGSRIPLHVVKTLVALIDWGMDAQAAVDLAHFGSRNGPFEIETVLAGAMPALQMLARGHRVEHIDAPSGLHMVVRRRSGRLEGGADPRREGVAMGD